MRRIGSVAVLFLSLAIAVYAAVAYGFFPLGALVHPDLRATFALHRAGIYTHVFASVVALALGPFQFSERLRARRLSWHRWSGRLYLTGVLIGGLAGLFMATHAFGGMVARSGFAGLAVAWLWTGQRAWTAIRARDIDAHRRWMIRNFALTFAAVTLRLWLPSLAAAGIAFERAYPVIAWICWVPNLLVAEALVASRPTRRRHPVAATS
jgi:uncharacterized membrane protein